MIPKYSIVLDLRSLNSSRSQILALMWDIKGTFFENVECVLCLEVTPNEGVLLLSHMNFSLHTEHTQTHSVISQCGHFSTRHYHSCR